jgi:uncharacterized protein
MNCPPTQNNGQRHLLPTESVTRKEAILCPDSGGISLLFEAKNRHVQKVVVLLTYCFHSHRVDCWYERNRKPPAGGCCEKEEEQTMNVPQQPVFYAVFAVTTYDSFDDAKTNAPDMIAAHIARSKELHAHGTLLMSGAFLNNPQEPLSTMAILTTYEAAEEYIKGDPFVQNGKVSKWYIREWANMFA